MIPREASPSKEVNGTGPEGQHGRPRLRALAGEWPLALLAAVAAAVYSTYALLRHWHFHSDGFDLGIFDQAVWHYSRFEAPASSIRGVSNLLGDHFHPILVVLAPFYWLVGRPAVLLVAQGVLLGLAVVPIVLFARKRVGAVPAYLIGTGFSLYWGIQRAVGFDFHEIAFAVPLIAFAVYFADERRWRLMFACLALLLLVKEDLSMFVAFFGIYLLALRQVRYALVAIAAGTGWFLLTTEVIIPALAGPTGFAYWTFTQFGPGPFSALKYIMLHPTSVLHVLVFPRMKVHTEFRIFYPFLLLAFASPACILAVPLILERFLSTNSFFWTPDFHYTATIAPVIAMASADGLANVTRLLGRERLRHLVRVATAGAIVAVNAILLFGTPGSPLRDLGDGATYRSTVFQRTGYAALTRIPADASVDAQDAIIPHVSERREVYELVPDAPATDYVIASPNLPPWPNASYEVIEGILRQRVQQGYRTIFDEGGWVVLRRVSPG
ncbi:MAG: DUF2079 domain-containing protein [Actinomycetota bacterium]